MFPGGHIGFVKNENIVFLIAYTYIAFQKCTVFILSKEYLLKY